MEPKILIGCPTYGRYRYCISRYLEAVKEIDYENCDLLLVDNSPDDSFFVELKKMSVPVERIEYCESARERIVRSRNLLREKAIKENYDYFFSLEQDVIAKPDTLKRLLSHNVPIVSAYYGNDMILTVKNRANGEISKIKINAPIAYLDAGNGQVRRASEPQIANKGLIQVADVGVGCMLISREVFEQIPFRFNSQSASFDDICFCQDAKNKGYKIMLDSDYKLEHLHLDWEKEIQK